MKVLKMIAILIKKGSSPMEAAQWEACSFAEVRVPDSTTKDIVNNQLDDFGYKVAQQITKEAP